MKYRLQDLIKHVILGSVASMTATNPNAGVEAHSVELTSADKMRAVGEGVLAKTDLKPKLLLRINQATEEWSYITHRSHRSHRSHSSHRSHYSSRTSTPRQQSQTPSSSVVNRKLGSRTLSRYSVGTDVSQLMRLLIDRDYLSERTLSSSEIYSFEVESAVKSFQKDRNLEPDGIAGPSTIEKLQEIPGISLGSRTLKKGMSGEDVTELIRILMRRKYLNARPLKKEEEFTEMVEEAVKAFQKDNSMVQTGVADPATILLLKNL